MTFELGRGGQHWRRWAGTMLLALLLACTGALTGFARGKSAAFSSILYERVLLGKELHQTALFLTPVQDWRFEHEDRAALGDTVVSTRMGDKVPVFRADVAAVGHGSTVSGLAGANTTEPVSGRRKAYYHSCRGGLGTESFFDATTNVSVEEMQGLGFTTHRQVIEPEPGAYAIVASADGSGAKFDQEVPDILAGFGIPVLADSNLRCLSQEKSPSLIARDILRIDVDSRGGFERNPSLFAGVSLDANPVHFAPAACLYGSDELPNACPVLASGRIHGVELQSWHNIGRSHDRITDVLVDLVVLSETSGALLAIGK